MGNCSQIETARSESTKNLQQLVYENIKKMVISGSIGFGEKLAEKFLAESFGVSRTPVREALLRLTHEGWIAKKDNTHFSVRDFSEKEIEEISDIRIALTNLVLEKVIAQGDEECIELLEENIQRCKSYMDKGDKEKLNYGLSEFHTLLHRAAQSPYLMQYLEGLGDQVLLGRAVTLTMPGVQSLLVSQHEELLQAIKKRDKRLAKKIMRSHIKVHKDRLLEALLRDRLAKIKDSYQD